MILKAGGVNFEAGLAGAGAGLAAVRRASPAAWAASAAVVARLLLGQRPAGHRHQRQEDGQKPHATSRSSTAFSRWRPAGVALRCVGVDVEVACLHQGGEAPLAQGRHGIGAGHGREHGPVDALGQPQSHHQRLLHQILPADQGRLRRAVALAFDRLQPGLRPARPPGGALACSLGEPAMRARPDADVILIPPIDQIMAAGSPGTGVVGDFVGGQAGGRQSRLGELEHRRRLVLGRQGEGAARMVGEEARAALDGELIERQVLAGQRQRPLELGRPGLLGLAGPRIDQVEGIAREMPARRGDGVDRLVGGMLTAEEAQRRRIERLHAQRHAIDAGLRPARRSGWPRPRSGWPRA